MTSQGNEPQELHIAWYCRTIGSHHEAELQMWARYSDEEVEAIASEYQGRMIARYKDREISIAHYAIPGDHAVFLLPAHLDGRDMLRGHVHQMRSHARTVLANRLIDDVAATINAL